MYFVLGKTGENLDAERPPVARDELRLLLHDEVPEEGHVGPLPLDVREDVRRRRRVGLEALALGLGLGQHVADRG